MLILKIAGAVLIIFSTAGLGFAMAKKYRERIKELRQLQIAFQMLSSEISYCATPLPFAFNRVGQKLNEPVSDIFLNAAELLENSEGRELGDMWRGAVNEIFPITFLNTKDKQILLSVSSFLGYSDQVHQEKQIKLILHQLKQSEEEAWGTLHSNERMWKYLGVLGGLMLVILFS